MARNAVLGLELGQRYKSRSARDHLKQVLDAAEMGSTAVITRDRPVAAVDAAVLEELLSTRAPFNVLSSVTDDQIAFWLEDGLVHATGATFDEAAAAFLDALVEYAEDWFDGLGSAPNHAHNRLLALRVSLHAGDREAFEVAVFGDE